MKFKYKHEHYVGRIFREGNHLFKVLWVFGPLYGIARYSYGIFSAQNVEWVKPLPWTAERLVKLGIVTND